MSEMVERAARDPLGDPTLRPLLHAISDLLGVFWIKDAKLTPGQRQACENASAALRNAMRPYSTRLKE